MGAVGGLFGLSGGVNGTGISGPSSQAGLTQPVTSDQINTAYTGNQNALQSQQALLQALQAQNGLGNQSQVYGQLQGVVNGTGPNPAQAMLNQATGQNVAQQAALMAGQRGASANAGLIARQAAQQGGAIQQNAVGQGASLQAQQSLNALTGAGNLANTQAGQQIAGTGANTQAQQTEQGQLLQGMQGFNAAQAALQGNVNTNNTALANTTMQGQQGTIGGIMNSIGPAAAAAGAEGGEVHHYDDGGSIVAPTAMPQGPQSGFGQFLSKWKANEAAMPIPADEATPTTGAGQLKQGASSMTKGILSAFGKKSGPGGQAMAGGPMDAGSIGSGAMIAAKGGAVRNLKGGGTVNAASKAEQAVSDGNDYANDKIPAVLSDGEYVLSREDMQVPAVRNLVAALKSAKGR